MKYSKTDVQRMIKTIDKAAFLYAHSNAKWYAQNQSAEFMYNFLNSCKKRPTFEKSNLHADVVDYYANAAREFAKLMQAAAAIV